MANVRSSEQGEGTPTGHAASSQGVRHPYDKLHAHVRPYAMMTRTCFMEFDPNKIRGRLPGIFARAVDPLISNSIYLQDINRNQIQVSILRKNGKIYFTHGWSQLKNFYDLELGGWVTVLYISPFIFHIKIRNINEVEVTYPYKNPPFKITLPAPLAEGSSTGPIPYFTPPTVFVYKLEKTLSSSDVESGFLTFCWEGLCQLALPHEEAQLTMVDWIGHTWKNCHFQIDNSTQMTCKISGQWITICKVHRLVKGVTITFGFIQPSNNRILHFKISPLIGVRTALLGPTTTGNRKAFYECERYYML